MAQYITEVLRDLNKDPSLFQTTYRKVGNGGPLGVLFMHAFTAQGKFLLPDGEPPYKPSPEPIGMTPARFIQEIRRFYLFTRKDLSNTKREQLFIQMLESVHQEEAKILIAVKDQTLTNLYPNITREAVAAAGFIPQLPPQEVKKEEAATKKSVRPRGRPRKSASPQVVL